MQGFRAKRAILTCPILVFLVLFISSCATGPVIPVISYKPPFIPVTFSIDIHGNISFQADASLVTSIGTFSVGVTTSTQPEDGTLLLTIRHKQNGTLVDSMYKIQTDQDEVTVVVNGTTTIQVTKNSILIDASKSDIKTITVKGSPPHSLHLGDVIYVYHGHSASIDAVAWSPDSKRIASGSADQTVQMWNALDGKNAYTYRWHSAYVRVAAWSPDGKYIASGGDDNTVQVWSAG